LGIWYMSPKLRVFIIPENSVVISVGFNFQKEGGK
jgi:hypothetical protein